jgi:intracellular multiplication protein IcmJ
VSPFFLGGRTQNMFKLIPGIKRSVFRDNDPQATQADAVFVARRPQVLERARYTCQGCLYRSLQTAKKGTKLQVHHTDDDHHHNEDSNLAPVCSLCHGYAHLGCKTTSTGGGGGLASEAQLAAIPELSAADLNNLLRAIGAAMADPNEAETAKQLYDMLCERVRPVREAFGTSKALDFAGALSKLSPTDYDNRHDVLFDLRLVWKVDVLKTAGKEMLEDFPSLKPSSWMVAYGDLVDETLAGA